MDATFAALRGEGIFAYAGVIKRIMLLTRAQTLLDYGSGQGFQYRERVVKAKAGHHHLTLAEFWGAQEIHCYDPAFSPFASLSNTVSDGVLVVNTLQYVPNDDLAWVVPEIFARACKFVFAVIGTPDAAEIDASGSTCPERDVASWLALFQAAASLAGHENTLWELHFNATNTMPGRKAQRFGNFLWLDDGQRYPPLEELNG